MENSTVIVTTVTVFNGDLLVAPYTLAIRVAMQVFSGEITLKKDAHA